MIQLQLDMSALSHNTQQGLTHTHTAHPTSAPAPSPFTIHFAWEVISESSWHDHYINGNCGRKCLLARARVGSSATSNGMFCREFDGTFVATFGHHFGGGGAARKRSIARVQAGANNIRRAFIAVCQTLMCFGRAFLLFLLKVSCSEVTSFFGVLGRKFWFNCNVTWAVVGEMATMQVVLLLTASSSFFNGICRWERAINTSC